MTATRTDRGEWSQAGIVSADQWADYYRRLLWNYGAERADRIWAGVDAATNADLRAWRNLGLSSGPDAA